VSGASSASGLRDATILICVLRLAAAFSGCADDGPVVDLELHALGDLTATNEPASFDPPAGDSVPVSGQLWLPSDPSGVLNQRFPAVAFLPASAADTDSYQMLLEHIASHGYAVLALSTVDQGRDPTRQARRLLSFIEQTVAAHPDTIDGESVALIGHSYGGKVALLAATIEHPIRETIRTVIAWDPIDIDVPRDSAAVSVAPELMPEVRVPTLLLGTPPSDCVLLGQNHDDFFDAAARPSLHLFFPNGDHGDWGDDFGESAIGFGIATQLCRRVGELNGEVLHRVTRRANVAWLKKHMSGERGMDRYLTGDGVPEIDSGIVVATQK